MEFQKPTGPNNVKGGKTTRPWTRSITQIFRAFRDSYVKGCVTASHNANVSRAAAGAAGFRAVDVDDHVLSRSSSRHVEDVISQDFLDLSAKFLRQGSSTDQKGFIQSSSINTPTGQLQGITLADLQGYSSTFRTASRPSFDAVPESEQYTETPTIHGSSKTALESLFRSSSLHPTEFLKPPSRRMATLETHNNQVAGASRGAMLTRGGSESRLRQTPSRFSNASNVDADANGRSSISNTNNNHNNHNNNNNNNNNHHPLMKPLSPMVDMSSFREENSNNHVGARKSVDFRRSVSRRREDLARFLSQRGPSQSVDADFEEFARSNSKKLANRPNPYRDYDSRAPSPTPTV